ncbi:hypothetical protein A1O3_02023 [Capronia epimyces CBS 606.96]|uniref:N-acetyltransferase domain-containing protein n=1 Tax=Capronia epimyces CBS 606.96 TaxID=1182542 RepID=W9Z386_9EURO|nr:uncharacterized protein A1O3_02023 [Capronia epimyces CBS 606.96]EXJ88959.1 hypothetical protein A1O3_02023 [Capronia epimyces CBS 606.96]
MDGIPAQTQTQATPFIRLYQDSDQDAMVHIFRETAAPDLRDAADPVLHYASYIWCRPYLMLQPDACLVLDDGTGHAVGYLLGVPHTPSFVERYERTYIPFLQTLGLDKPEPGHPTDLPNALRQIMFTPRGMLHDEHPELLRQWPAHLHIDILPPFQKHGYGRQLMEQFCERASASGARGVHLLMAASNEQAGKFYDRLGFLRFPAVLDDGASGEKGRDPDTIWLVKNL